MTDFITIKGLSREVFQEEYWRPIHYLTSVGDVEGIKSLLSQGEDANSSHSNRAVPQLSPLHIACITGNIEVVKLLLPHANVNKADQYGYTALHYATVARRREIVSLLLSSGASAGSEAKSGTTARDLAEELSFDDIADTLSSQLKLQQDPTLPKFKAWLTSIGGGEYVRRFVEAGYDLAFIAGHGLSDVDLDCVGVPKEKMGLRRKITSLHGLDKFYQKEEEDEEDDEVEEDEEGESEED